MENDLRVVNKKVQHVETRENEWRAFGVRISCFSQQDVFAR